MSIVTPGAGFRLTGIPNMMKSVALNVFPNIAYNNSYTLSGLLVTDTYKTILSLTVGGMLGMAAVRNLTVTTAHTVTLRMTLDGVAMEIVMAFTATNDTACALGILSSVQSGALLPVQFDNSALFEIKTSVGGTDQVGLMLYYVT